MCLGFLPPGGTRFRKHRRPNGGGAKNEKSWNTVRRSAKKRKQKKKQQLTLQDCFGFDVSSLSEEENEAIEASGDPLIDKESGSVRFAFQNIHGISIREGLHVMPEIATMGALQIDVAALTETNVHWNQANREKMAQQLYTHLGHSRVVCASNVSTRNEDGYQPGGSMLAVVGPQCGRMQKRGSDPWGRFSWTEMRGGRDEGILVISAYRVSQKRGAKAGPFTAYSQQVDNMIREGDHTLDPRTRILTDLENLITEKRALGFRPILMMDANDDWLDSKSTAFRSFLERVQLVDPMHNKFSDGGITPTTYARGIRRIDFIFVDATIEPAIKRIGSLGLHEGINSDHVMLYMDCDEDELFKGVLNRPVLNPAREFVIEHADKCEKFLERFWKLAKEKRLSNNALFSSPRTLKSTVHQKLIFGSFI